MSTPKSTPEEKDEICEKAFSSIYPSCTHKDINFIASLKDILGNNIAKRIENFNCYNKPAIFFGDSISLIRGAIAYLWHTHGQITSPRVLNCSGLKEDEAKTKISGDWIESAFTNLEACTYMGNVLFIEDLSPHESLLKWLWKEVDSNKPLPGTLAIGMDNTGNLPQGLLNRFEVIEIQEKGISVSTPENTNYNWAIDGDKVFSNKQIVELAGIKLKLFKCLHSKKGKYVYNETLKQCWDIKPGYEKFLVDTMNELEHTLKEELKQSEKIIESKKKGKKNIAYKLPI